MTTPLAVLFALTLTGATLTRADHNCDHHSNCHNMGEIQLDIDLDDNSISLAWKVNSTEFIYGYRVIVETDESSIYESPVLNKHTESMDVTVAIDGGDFKVCLVVLMNETETIVTKCEVLEVSDLQMVIGILAGVVFLIPCITALTYIIFKDRQILKTDGHDTSEVKVLIKEVHDVEIVAKITKPRPSLFGVGKVNECFEGDSKPETDTGEKGKVSKGAEATVAIESEVTSAKINTDKTDKDINSEGKGKEDVKQPAVDEEITDKGQTTCTDVDKETVEKEFQEIDLTNEEEIDTAEKVEDKPSACNTKL